MSDVFIKAMKEVSELNETGIKVSGGKKYTQVVTRVEVFRKHFGDTYGINTEVAAFGTGYLIKATVVNGNNRIVGSGHAYSSDIKKEKSIEKLETTAIGRALASCGLAGGEYATQDEIDSFDERYTKPEASAQTETAAPLKPFSGDEQVEMVKGLRAAKNNAELEEWKIKARAAWKRMESPEQRKHIEDVIAEMTAKHVQAPPPKANGTANGVAA